MAANIIPTLKQVDIFCGLTVTQLELIAGLCAERSYRRDEIIFPEGADSDELYIVLEGGVDIVIVRGANTPEVSLVSLQRGQSFGEIALVDQGLRSATARAQHSGARLLTIGRDQLMTLCSDFPQLGFCLMRNLAADLAQKMRSTDLRLHQELQSNSHKS